MKKQLLTAMLLVMAFGLAGCGETKTTEETKETETQAAEIEEATGESEIPETEAESEAVSEETEQAEDAESNTEMETQAPETNAADPYAEVNARYQQALTEGWDMDQLDEADMNILMAAEYESEDCFGYLELDIDQDGSPELLIGPRADGEEPNEIMDLYSIVKGEPTRLISGGDREHYYLCEDGSIYYEGAESAFTSYTISYEFCGDYLRELQNLRYDWEMDNDNPWFLVDGENYEPISEEDYNSIWEELWDSCVELDYQAFE